MSCLHSTSYTVITPSLQLKQHLRTKDSLGCFISLLVWCCFGQQEEKGTRISSDWSGYVQSLLAEAVRAPLKPERKPATTKLCTGTEQGQLEWPFLSFLCAHNRQKEKKDNSVLMTLTLGPSGAMPQLIYLMLQPDFFFFFFKCCCF